jgi:hypothetical protein
VSKAKAKEAKCKTPGCKKPVHAKGYCKTCFNIHNNHQDKKKASTVKVANEKKHPVKTKDAEIKHKPEAAEDAPIMVKGKPGRKSRGANGQEATKATGEALKLTRVQLIRDRHEAMKREIDQIREDLESEEEE